MISKTIEHYEKFLELWKDSDPVFTEVDDAKTRLAGLMGRDYGKRRSNELPLPPEI